VILGRQSKRPRRLDLLLDLGHVVVVDRVGVGARLGQVAVDAVLFADLPDDAYCGLIRVRVEARSVVAKLPDELVVDERVQ
jgi:hypothetical protein